MKKVRFSLAAHLCAALLLLSFLALPTVSLAAPAPGTLTVSPPRTYRVAFPSAARTTTVSNPPAGFDVGDIDNLQAYLKVTATSGTTPTLDIVVEDSPDGGVNWFTLVAFTQVTTSNSSQAVSPAAGRKIGNKVRVTATIGGTTPSYTFAVWLYYW